MKILKLLSVFLFFYPSSFFAQTIQENLEYINTQFDQFNKYQTSFAVDEVAKKIICRDKFGMYSAFLNDVEMKKDESGKSIGIFCLDESKCISSLKKDGSVGPGFSNYTLELSQDGVLISNADTVLEKFSIIKKSILEGDFRTSNFQISTLKYKVALQLQALNAIFQEHSHYQNIWSFDWENQQLVGRTETCEVRIALENVTVEFYEKENQQKYRFGFVFKSSGSDILEKCPSFENNVSKTYEYVDSLEYAEKAIDAIKTIQNLVSEGPFSLSPTPSQEDIDRLLGYINNQFKKYNAFNTRFFVDLENKELVWIQDFGEIRTSIDQIDFKADYENGWIVIFCKNESLKCISFTTPNSSKIQYTEYSMSLKENDKIILHIEDVIKKFDELVDTVSN